MVRADVVRPSGPGPTAGFIFFDRKENEAKETLPLRGACRLLTFGAVKGGDAKDG
jgi:hypothetical protein